MTICNRTIERAEHLRDELSDPRVAIGSLEDVADILASARLVVAAVEVPSPVITRADLERCREDVLIVDLGLPRAVASDVSGLANVRRIDIGDLRERVGQALGLSLIHIFPSPIGSATSIGPSTSNDTSRR